MPVADWTPTVPELAVFLKTRTKTRWGVRIGDFTADTPVTAEDATGLITEAINEVALAIGPDLPLGPEDDPDFYKRGAKSAVMLLAGMNVELALDEDVEDDNRTYRALERRFNSLMKVLVEAIAEGRGGSDDGGDSAALGSGAPAYGGFDEPNRTTMSEKF